MGVGRFSRRQRGVGVLAIPDAGLDKTRYVESACNVPLRAGVLRQFVAVGVVINHHCVADGVEAKC
jgi:hypothetical protein